jgi:hypothetical protein
MTLIGVSRNAEAVNMYLKPGKVFISPFQTCFGYIIVLTGVT